MQVNYNISAMIANNALVANDNKLAESIERLSRGLKIANAKDTPSGLAISRRMNAQIKSLGVAKGNSGDAISVIQTADGTLTEVHDILQRMSELAIQAANEANEFGYIVDSNIKRIRLYISFIRKYDEEIQNILDAMHELVDANETTDFVKQIHLIETFKGAGFLSAVSLMGEIGDFSAFSKPKQLFAYFGLDPAVKQSGKFEGTRVKMSKRGSAIARRVIHTLTLQSISTSRSGDAKNPVLRDYYLKKCKSKFFRAVQES